MGRGATRADCCALTSGSPRVLQTMTKQPVEEVVIERILEFGDAVTRTVIVSNDRLWPAATNKNLLADLAVRSAPCSSRLDYESAALID